MGGTYRYEGGRNWVYTTKSSTQVMNFEIGDKDVKNLENKLLIFYFCDEIIDPSDLPKFTPHFKFNNNSTTNTHITPLSIPGLFPSPPPLFSSLLSSFRLTFNIINFFFKNNYRQC